MAESETNPVLQVIDLHRPLVENKKYPTDLLQFSQLGWRAYYHCHPADRAGNHCFKSEHGHFHIFVRIHKNPEKWSHLVALAMDNVGQPLGWFTVNHWVTGEEWISAEILVEYLTKIPFDKTESLIERWLLSLLSLNRNSLNALFHERDKIINQKQSGVKEIDIKNDKGLYLLSEQSINIKELLHFKTNND